jgi:hypothetical protein
MLESPDRLSHDAEAYEAEIPADITDAIASWRRTIHQARPENTTSLLERAAVELWRLATAKAWDGEVHQAIVDSLQEMADFVGIDPGEAQLIIVGGKTAPPDRFDNGHNTAAPAHPTPPTSAPTPIVARAFAFRGPADIAARPWLFGRHYVCGFLSTTMGRPGIGKTDFAIAEFLSMVSGRPLIGCAPEKPLRVWYIGEDPFDEIERRITAVCAYHRVNTSELAGRLFINSSLDLPPMKVAEMKGRAAVLNQPMLDQLRAEITVKRLDALILDPLIKFHGVPESDNSMMEMVLTALGRVAHDTRIAIDLLHHLRKQAPGSTGPATIDDGRGASAIIGAVRSARIANPMSPAEAERAGIIEGDRWRYIRIDRPKGNMAPPETAAWLQHASEILPCGESVGVISTWKFPDPFDNVTGADVSRVRGLAQTCAHRADPRSKNSFHGAVAELLGLDLNSKPDRAKVKALIRTWLKNKVLDIEQRHDPEARKEFDFIVPGPFKDEIPDCDL